MSYRLSVPELERLVSEGDVVAMNNLAVRFERGDGVAEDLARSQGGGSLAELVLAGAGGQAFDLFLLAASKGCQVAQGNIYNAKRLGMSQHAVPIFGSKNTVWNGEGWLNARDWDGAMINSLTGRKQKRGSLQQLQGPLLR